MEIEQTLIKRGCDSTDDIHRFRSDCPESINVDIIPKIWSQLFNGKAIYNHPPRFIFHGGNKRLVEIEQVNLEKSDFLPHFGQTET